MMPANRTYNICLMHYIIQATATCGSHGQYGYEDGSDDSGQDYEGKNPNRVKGGKRVSFNLRNISIQVTFALCTTPLFRRQPVVRRMVSMIMKMDLMEVIGIMKEKILTE